MKCFLLHLQHIENISSRTGGRYVSSPSAFYILRVYVKTRPSVNYAKDWMDHSFVFPCLVWSGKGFHFGCDHQGGSQQTFSCVLGHFQRRDERTNKQPGDPSVSLLLTNEKNTFYHKMTGGMKTLDDPAHL